MQEAPIGPDMRSRRQQALGGISIHHWRGMILASHLAYHSHGGSLGEVAADLLEEIPSLIAHRPSNSRLLSGLLEELRSVVWRQMGRKSQEHMSWSIVGLQALQLRVGLKLDVLEGLALP